ncbi:MAG: hypothetical protein FWF47_01785, partial [Clostridia bacterium]|nr:hypothetical protein [Clostridia bacterium]
MLNGSRILERLHPVGVVLLIIGALLCYLAGRVAARLFPRYKQRALVIIKAAGLLIAIIGVIVV